VPPQVYLVIGPILQLSKIVLLRDYGAIIPAIFSFSRFTREQAGFGMTPPTKRGRRIAPIVEIDIAARIRRHAAPI
jgi:hypothetical protein